MSLDVIFQTVQFEASLIRREKLHLSDKSMTLMMINRELKTTLPTEMAICYLGDNPIGWAAIAVVDPDVEPTFREIVGEESEPLGWLNIYVLERYRRQGIGRTLVDIAERVFAQQHPEVERLLVDRCLRKIYVGSHRLDPVFASRTFRNRVRFSERVRRIYDIRRVVA